LAEGGEMRGVVFAISYILIFSAFVSSIPVDLQGQGSFDDELTPINPNLLIDFSDLEQYFKGNFTGILTLSYVYDLPVGGTTYDCLFSTVTDEFALGAHIIVLGVWLGGIEFLSFKNENGTDRGTLLSFTDIDNDAVEGTSRYTLTYEDTGNSGGGFIFYWNETTYSSSEDAWTADELYLLHGVGIEVNTNIANLLLSLIFLQVPDMPILLNVIIIGPLWANIAYLAWWLITKSLPLIG